MHSFLCAFVLAVSFTLVTPQCTPEQWQGTQTAKTAFADHRTHGQLEEHMSVSYDAENNRSSVFLQSNYQGTWSFYQILTVYNGSEGNRYVIDLMTDKCTVTELETPFRRVCIPDGSVFAGNFFLGLKGDFNVSSYYAFKYMITTNIIVSHVEDEIVPVIEILSGRLGIYDVVQTLTFRDITPGIKSEHIFDVPAECSYDDAWLADAPHLTRNQYFLAL